MCIAELNDHDNQQLNASSETTLVVQQQQQHSQIIKKQQLLSNGRKSKPTHSDLPDYLFSSNGHISQNENESDEEDLTDEFPLLNPTIVENYDDRGFCEPYRGTVCASIITGNYSVYSTSSQQQNLIEERLKSIVPLLLSNKNNLSKGCSTFAIPSLCLFAFPLCDRQTKQPKQICRSDCNQLQQNFCKNEYFNVMSLFESKIDLSNTNSNSLPNTPQSSSGSFLLDCNQLPPSSDSAKDCVPIVTMTLDKLESNIIRFSQKGMQESNTPTQTCIISNGVEYRGTQSITRGGFTCQRWSDQYPHMHHFKSLPELDGHNFCRNLDNDAEPWCFTTNPARRKDYCHIPKCVNVAGGLIDQAGGGGLDSSVLSEKKLVNILYVLVPGICVPFLMLCIVLTFCYCRRIRSATVAGSGSHKSSNVSARTNESGGGKANASGVSSNLNSVCNSNHNNGGIHPSRMRMSNASLGHHKKQQQHQLIKTANGRICSSKSSVASGSTTNTNGGGGGAGGQISSSTAAEHLNPFLKPALNNYDNYYNQFGAVVTTANNLVQQQQQLIQLQNVNNQAAQLLMPPPPPLPIMPLGLSMPPPPTTTGSVPSDYMPLRQVDAENIRFAQEIGKGRFGAIFIGDLLSFSSSVRVTIKTFDRKLFAKSTHKNFAFPAQQQQAENCLIQTTSTPNVNNLKMNHLNSEKTATASNDLPSAEEHFMEQEFYNEISLYSNLRHKHLANLIAINTRKRSAARKENMNNERQLNLDSDLSEVDEADDEESSDMPKCMIFEHLNCGDLHEYLQQRHLQMTQNQPQQQQQQQQQQLYGMNGIYGSQSNLSAVSSSIGGASNNTPNYLSIQQQQRNIADFLYIGLQIASGMEYLAGQNFILKDLATRNILMSDTMTVKISVDLVAQYKEQYSPDYYKFQMKLLPVRWMSPESLLYGRYAQQSDVWSYGVCLWEIFSYGMQPYSGCTNPEAIEMIRDRQLLGIPEDCPQRAYALMLECWHDMVTQRPTFTDIINKLRNWENYYLFNGYQQQQQQQSVIMSSLPPPPPPLLSANTQMTSSYSSNSQGSKTSSSIMANTVSTGVSTMSNGGGLLPQPLIAQYQNGTVTTSAMNGFYYSPSKTNVFNKTSPPSSTVTTSTMSNNLAGAGQFNRYFRDFRDTLDPMSSLRMSQRQCNNNNIYNNNNNNNNNNNINNNNNNNINNNNGAATFASSIFGNIPTTIIDQPF